MNISIPPVRPAEPHQVQTIDVFTDTREILAHARNNALKRGFAGLVRLRHRRPSFRNRVVEGDRRIHRGPGGSRQCNALSDRPRRRSLWPLGRSWRCATNRSAGVSLIRTDSARSMEETGVHRDVVLTRRAMDSLGIDYMVVFPTPMLLLGMHPQPEMEVWLGNAYNRWLIDRILPPTTASRSLDLPAVQYPAEAERTVKQFADKKGVIGFCVTSTRYKPVHHNDYMRLYSMIQEIDKPIAFHAGYHWQDQSLATVNRFLGMHALGFVWCNHRAHDELDAQRYSRAVPEAQVAVGRERPRLGAVPDAAARRSGADAAVGSAAAQAAAERIHEPAIASTPCSRWRRRTRRRCEMTLDMIKARDAAHVRVGLAALRFRSAAGDLRSAVPVGAGQAQHSRPERRAEFFNLDPTPRKKL